MNAEGVDLGVSSWTEPWQTLPVPTFVRRNAFLATLPEIRRQPQVESVWSD